MKESWKAMLTRVKTAEKRDKKQSSSENVVFWVLFKLILRVWLRGYSRWTVFWSDATI